MKPLAGRTALVTGAGGGIGTAFVRLLASEGMNVAATDLDIGRATAACAGLDGDRVRPFTLDVTDEAEWRRVADDAEATIGPIDLFVSNAGIGAGCVVAEDDPKRWKMILEVNAYGPFLGCRTLLPRMLSRGGDAHILFVASMAALTAHATMSSYIASKHALMGLSDTLRAELAGTGVGVSIVLPGVVATDFVALSREVIGRRIGSVAPTQGVGELHKSGMSPDAVVRRAIEAVQAGDYHVFTHAGWKDRLRAIQDERIAAFGDSAEAGFVEPFAALDDTLSQHLERPAMAASQD